MSTAAKIGPTCPRVFTGRLEPVRRERRLRTGREKLEENAPSPAALMLVLAHHIQRSIDAGEICDQAEAARRFGITRARLTQILDLLLLSSPIQQRILDGDDRATERILRGALRAMAWTEQTKAIPHRQD